MVKSEFSVSQPWTTDPHSPVRWILSHIRRNWWIVLIVFLGATGNAVLALSLIHI